MTASASDWAEAYAAAGWAVFPCRPDKRPHAADDLRHGLHDATTDHTVIRRWWTRWPNALIGLPTAGLLVVDLDPPDGLNCWRRMCRGEPEEWAELTQTVRTPRGGLHIYFDPIGATYRNTAGRLGPGIDTRGDGGYVIAPPSAGYEHIGGDALRRPPVWLRKRLAALDTPPPAASTGTPHRSTVSAARARRYGAAAIDSECANVATAAEGTRNHTLNAAAFNLGQLIAAGVIDHNDAVAQLRAAAHTAGLTAHEANATIRSGIRSGSRQPRRIAS